MKKVFMIAGVVIVVAGGVFVFMKSRNKATVTDSTTGQSQTVQTGSEAYVAVDACDVLTKEVAVEILGPNAKKADVSAGNASTDDLSVSNCIYTVQIDPGALKAHNTKGVSLLARAAKTSTGAESNKAVFGSQKPAGVQDVSGIGDAAYFNPTYGQLNVLKGNNWYIVTSYSGSATSGTVASDTELAKLLNFQ